MEIHTDKVPPAKVPKGAPITAIPRWHSLSVDDQDDKGTATERAPTKRRKRPLNATFSDWLQLFLSKRRPRHKCYFNFAAATGANRSRTMHQMHQSCYAGVAGPNGGPLRPSVSLCKAFRRGGGRQKRMIGTANGRTEQRKNKPLFSRCPREQCARLGRRKHRSVAVYERSVGGWRRRKFGGGATDDEDGIHSEGQTSPKAEPTLERSEQRIGNHWPIWGIINKFICH